MTETLFSQEYLTLVEFLLEKEPYFMEIPIRGQLHKVASLFNEYMITHKCSSLMENDQFFKYIDTFNQISDVAIKLSTDNGSIEWINRLKLGIVRGKLGERDEGMKSNEEVVTGGGGGIGATDIDNIGTRLLSLLHQDLYTQPFQHKDGIINHCGYPELNELINTPSATSIMSKKIAQIRTPIKRFYEVCDDQKHNSVLSNVCLNKKLSSKNSGSCSSYKNSVHKKSHINDDLPTTKQCHQAIDLCNNLFSKEILKCSKSKVHYLPIITSHTDISQGDCSYLDTCHKMKTCKYLHYYTLVPDVKTKDQNDNKVREKVNSQLSQQEYTIGFSHLELVRNKLPPQWINCDVRYIPFPILGKFAAIISDPAWDIHMNLPYGTCKDPELLSLPMHELQDEGIIFLWVTGRSMEVGRQALVKWGYRISDEIIWIKLNQLRRTIVTGRTGHWLNHSKEHLLVGIKGNPAWLNRMIDTNVVVSGTRETLRKPDEIYDIVERTVGPHARKLEIFGRDHNRRPGWLTIGNQVLGTSLVEQEIKLKYEAFMKKSSSTQCHS